MTLVLDKLIKPRLKRWTKREYNELVELGAFRGQHTFLFRGELIEMPPKGTMHARAVTNVSRIIFRIFDPEYAVRIQLPLVVSGESMPEPDIAVCTAEAAVRIPHPDSAVILIEVSDTSLNLDRDKVAEYAAAGIPEYWILDVTSRQLEVYREPVLSPSAELGYRYALMQTIAVGGSIASLAKPTNMIAVADMLP